jgi:hypothetical protein
VDLSPSTSVCPFNSHSTKRFGAGTSLTPPAVFSKVECRLAEMLIPSDNQDRTAAAGEAADLPLIVEVWLPDRFSEPENN